MKTFFKSSLVSLLVGLSLGVSAAPDEVPVCNEMVIASYKQEIMQRERINMFARSVVYVCAASAMVYAGCKIINSFKSSDNDIKNVLVDHAKILTTNAADLEAIKQRLEMKPGSVEAAVVPHTPFLSKAWFNNFCLGVRDIAIQIAMVTGVKKVGEVLKDTLFYDNSVQGFVVRSGYMKRALATIVNCVVELETPVIGSQQMPLIKKIFKQRCVELGRSIELTIAYMRYLGDCVDEKDRGALTLAENLLINRADVTLTALWSLTNKENPEELASDIMLALHLFNVDFEQACVCFDNAYAAVWAANA